LRKDFPKLHIIIVTMHVEKAFADSAFQNGAAGFVPKEAPAEELRSAISTVMGGGRYLSPRVVMHRKRDDAAASIPLLERLTPRQQEILRLTAEGKTAAEAAKLLGVSPRTIEFHRLRIRRVLGITTESGLLRFAILVSLGGTEAGTPPAP
jgi:DNA-binding NarL/FixJ family response regulator